MLFPAATAFAGGQGYTGEYPTAEGARCMDVDYRTLAGHSGEGTAAEPTFVAPPNPDGATIVDIGMFVNEITSVNISNNTFRLSGYLDMIWCDPRLVYDESNVEFTAKLFLEEDASAELEHIWWPDIDFVNEISGRGIENEELLIFADGTVEYREKFSIELATEYYLRSFPFDTQVLLVEIESFAWASDTLVFHLDEEVVGFSTEFSIPQWEVTDIHERITERQEIRDRSPFSEFIAEITIERDPGFYITKIIIPLGVIILLSLIVFWLDGSSLGGRIGVSFTGLLTAVAFQFTVSGELPRHVYNSYLDVFVAFSFLFILLSIMESGYVASLHAKEKAEQAMKVDKISRWLFPLVYIGVLILLYFVYTG